MILTTLDTPRPTRALQLGLASSALLLLLAACGSNSSDEPLIAIDARALFGSGYFYSTLVFDVASQAVLGAWGGAYNTIWAPDGSSKNAFLAVPSDDEYFTSIFAADLASGLTYALDLSPVLEFGSSHLLRTVNGPLSWNH